MKNFFLFSLLFALVMCGACRSSKTTSNAPTTSTTNATTATTATTTSSSPPSKSTSPSTAPLTAVYTGYWHDRSGLDGCAWMIELKDAKIQNQEWLIPINTADFKLQPKEGQMIQFNCEVISQMNICMAGTTIKFTAIK